MNSELIVPPELQPILDLHPEGWELITRSDDDSKKVSRVLFLFRGRIEYSTGVWFFDNSWDVCARGNYCGMTFKTVEEAAKLVKELILAIVRTVNQDDIMEFRLDDGYRRFIDTAGIGPKTIERLEVAFTTLERLQRASLEDIEKVPGIGKDKAWLIASRFNPDISYNELWDPKSNEWVKLYQIPPPVRELWSNTRRKVTQTDREEYRLTRQEIEERGLVKVKGVSSVLQ